MLKNYASTLLDNNKKIEDELDFIEFYILMNIIFIARLLNKNARLLITEEKRKRESVSRNIILSLNVHKEIERMETCIDYFDKWRQRKKDKKKILKIMIELRNGLNCPFLA